MHISTNARHELASFAMKLAKELEALPDDDSRSFHLAGKLSVFAATLEDNGIPEADALAYAAYLTGMVAAAGDVVAGGAEVH